MFDDLIRNYKEKKGINSVGQAKQAVRGKRGPTMQITPGAAMGWAPNGEEDRTGVEMSNEKYWNAKDPQKEKENSGKASNSRQLLSDAKKS